MQEQVRGEQKNQSNALRRGGKSVDADKSKEATAGGKGNQKRNRGVGSRKKR